MKSNKWQLIQKLTPGFNIDENTANQRLDRFLRKLFRPYPDISLSMIFKAVRKGDITIQKSSSSLSPNSTTHSSLSNPDTSKTKKVSQSYRLQVWDRVVFTDYFLELFSHKNPANKKTYSNKNQITYDLSDFKSRILSEDDEWLILNKPAGITIHPSHKIDTRSLGANKKRWAPDASVYDLIKQYHSSRGFAGSMFQPNVAYRLDRQTSGLLIVAKTYRNLQYLNEIIREREIKKHYYTIVYWNFPDELVCQQAMKKIVDPKFNRWKMIVCDDQDEYAQTAHTVGYNEKTWSDPMLGQLSLVKVQLHTWRMHQIRVHFSYAGYPVLGDIVYGLPSANRKLFKKHHIKRQLLHCYEYSFTDQDWQNLHFSAPLPEDFNTLIS